MRTSAAPRERFVDADGLFVHTVEWSPDDGPVGDGPADDDSPPAGPPVLLVHGLGGSTTNWIPVGGAIADRLGAQVVAIDLAGFGRTRSDGRPASLGVNGRLLEAYARDRGPFLVVGNSMGGALAVGLAARHPELVAGLVLVDPAVPGPRRTPRQFARAVRFAAIGIPRIGTPLMDGRARALGPERLVDQTIRVVMARPERLDPDVRAEMIAQTKERTTYREASRSYAEAAGSLFRYLASRMHDDLDDVDVPTTIVHGAQDRLVPLPFVQTVATRRPDWTLEVIDDCGHVPMLEHPGRFTDLVAVAHRRATGHIS